MACKKRLEVSRKDSHLRTLCDVQICCLGWKVWSILLICHCVSPHSSTFVTFICWVNMVAIQISQNLVVSARLYMKMASWGFCVLVFASSGEPGNCPEEMVCGVP